MKDDFQPYPLHINSYFNIVSYNELLIGQTKSHFFGIQKFHNQAVFLDFSNLYICITGLKKSVYTGIYQLSASRYMNIYLKIKRKLSDYLNSIHYTYEVILFVYGQKEIILLLSPTSESVVTHMEAVKKISHILDDEYERELLPANIKSNNFTVLSPRLTSFEEIAPAFQNLLKLHRMSFFCTGTYLLTSSILASLRQPAERETLFETLGEIEHSISDSDQDTAIQLLHYLMLTQLKNCCDFSSCQDVISELKTIFHRYNTIYELEIEEQIENTCHLNSYVTIEDLHFDLYQLLIRCINASKFKKPIGYLCLEAIRYIKKHYKQEITLTDVAYHVHVVPNYLSRIFNREMDMSLPSYLNAYRMTQAKHLLSEQNLKISEIARAVGISNAHHFSQLFRKSEGMTPSEYREQYSQIKGG